MKRLVLSLALISLVLTGTSFGAWQETFTGGFDRSDWYFKAMNNGAYTQSTSGDIYRATTATYPTQTPKGADQVIGLVSTQTASDFTMGAWFNVDATQYDPNNPSSYNDSSIALLGRANLSTGCAYGIGFNRGWGHFRMIKMTYGQYSNFPNYYSAKSDGKDLDAPYYVQWTAKGSDFNVKVFDANYALLADWNESDSSFTSGNNGIMTFLNPSVSSENSPLYPYPSLMNATLDDVTVSAYEADFNCDGVVTFSDYLVLSYGFGGKGHTLQGDANGSGTVNFADYLVLSYQFGSTGGAVPEPITLALFGLGALLLRRKA